jgi:hypothetical protein
MSDWPKYDSHKVVQAAKIVSIQRTPDGRTIEHLVVLPDNGGPPEHFMPTQAGMESRVGIGDYAILYLDGFKSVSPAKPFEEGYTRVQQ